MSLLCSLTGIALLYLGAVQTRPSLTPISRINTDFIGLKTKISGRVIDLHGHSEGHVFLKVKDNSGGVISVPVFSGVNSKLNEKIELLDTIQIEGRIENYRGELEIIPEGAESIQVVRSPPLNISKIDTTKLGEIVKTQGVIISKNTLSNGSLLLGLRKENDELTVFIPQDAVEWGGFTELFKGVKIRVSGLVQSYEGELELKVDDPHNLDVLEDFR